MAARRLLLALLVAAAWLASAAPAVLSDRPDGRAVLVLANLLGDDVFDAADEPATGRLIAAAPRARPATPTRVTGAYRAPFGPFSSTGAPDVAAPPAPRRTRWLAGGTDSRAGQLASGIAGIRAPPASSI